MPAPEQGLILTHFITVRDVTRSRDFYANILDGQIVLAENPGIVKVANSWIILNPGGGPTPDKPDVSLAPPEMSDTVSGFLNVRVADIAAFQADATAIPYVMSAACTEAITITPGASRSVCPGGPTPRHVRPLCGRRPQPVTFMPHQSPGTPVEAPADAGT